MFLLLKKPEEDLNTGPLTVNEFRDRYGMTPRACSDALAGREQQA